MEDFGESHGFQGGSGGGISARRQSVNRYLTANQLTKRGGGGGRGIIRMLQSLIGDPVPFIVTQPNTSGAPNDKQRSVTKCQIKIKKC